MEGHRSQPCSRWQSCSAPAWSEAHKKRKESVSEQQDDKVRAESLKRKTVLGQTEGKRRSAATNRSPTEVRKITQCKELKQEIEYWNSKGKQLRQEEVIITPSQVNKLKLNSFKELLAHNLETWESDGSDTEPDERGDTRTKPIWGAPRHAPGRNGTGCAHPDGTAPTTSQTQDSDLSPAHTCNQRTKM